MSALSSHSVVVATILLAVLVSVLWIDDGPLALFSVGRRNVLHEDSDYVYLLQSQPLHLESGSTVFVVDGNGAAEPTQQLVQSDQAVNSARVVVAAAGPPAEPALEAEVVSFPQTVAKEVTSPSSSMHMAGLANYNKVIEYLQLGSASSGFHIWYVVIPVIIILAILSVFCIYTSLQKENTLQPDLYRSQSPGQALSARLSSPPSQYQRSAHDKPVHEPNSMPSQAPRQGHSFPEGASPSPVAVEALARRPNTSGERVSMAPVSVPPSLQDPPPRQQAPLSIPPSSSLAPTPAPSLPADTGAPDVWSACTAVPASLCSQLALPACEGRFAVPLQALTDISKEGTIDIVGNSGIRFFVLTVKQVGGQRMLHMSLSSPASAQRVTIGPPASGLRADRALEIHAGGLDASLYGMLLPRPNGQYHVVQNGQTQMTLGDQAGDVRLQVKNVDGQIIASVTSSSEGFGGVLHLVVRIHPSVDPVLILACMFSVILLC